MSKEIEIIKPEFNEAERRIIEMVAEGLPSANSCRAYRRHLGKLFTARRFRF